MVVDPKVFPPALAGLMIAAFAAAYMSTVATQLNWGASYLVNDFYRRFLVKSKPEKHYVFIGQLATLILMLLSSVVTDDQDSIAGAEVPDGRWRWYRRDIYSPLVLVAN